MNFRYVGKLLGGVNLFLCALMLPSLLLALADGVGWQPFGLTIGLGALITGLALARWRGSVGEIQRREGFLLVVAIWLSASLVGALPFWFSGYFESFTDAFFEAVSGYTTTGATVMARVSHLPRGLLLWRAMMQWLGGMGIVLLSLAVMPLLGIGGVHLFKAEVPGPSVEKIRPRIRATAKLLWWVYAALTGAAVLSLWWAGMTPFDAVCHAFTVMSTGGFSTHDHGIMGFASPAIEGVLIVFMLLAGCNFVLHYHALTGRWKIYAGNEEFRWYLGAFSAISVGVLGLLMVGRIGVSFGGNLRDALFQTASLMTTTGYHSADFEVWRQAVPGVFMLLTLAFFLGGMGGSTAGGIKIARIVVVLKVMYNALRGLTHPRALIRLRVNDVPLPQDRQTIILVFIGLHLMVFLLGATIMAVLGLDVVSAVSSTAACLNNIGPGFGVVGPLDNYAALPGAGKWVLAVIMLIGRLELFTVLVLFIPDFWRK